MASQERDQLIAAIEHLASFERGSCSDGERQAAGWIAEQLRASGLEPAVEEERASGTYWQPMALLSGVGLAAGVMALRGRRLPAAALGALAAAGIADDCSGGPQLLRRFALPKRTAWNVVADAGDRTALETLVLVAHHDAAQTGVVFDQRPVELVARLAPDYFERANRWPELFRAIAGGPALVAAGALAGSRAAVRAGMALGALSVAGFLQIGASPVVPGANDNLSGVAVLLALARRLAEQPVAGLRVVLVSTGSEESFMEGMRGFIARHAARLSPPHTRIVAVDTVGSSAELVVPESEGMIVQTDYDAELKDELSAAAADAGVHLRRGLRLSFASDALTAMRAGYRAVMLGSVNEYKVPSNYHKPSDTPQNLAYERVQEAVELCHALVRRLAGDRAPAAAVPS